MRPAQSQSFHDISIDGDANSLTINQIIQISASAIRERPFLPSSPYVGLRRFDEESQALFFGRDALIAQLLSAVKEHPFSLVAGASGSGKSSVVRAGLLPQLRQRLPGAHLRAFTMTPDRDPFESLRISLATRYRQQDLEAARSASPDTLMNLIKALRTPDELWLIFIDQFEEIFTLCDSEVRRSAFLEGLVRIARADLPYVKLVVAIRSDFLDRLDPHPALARLVQEYFHLVTSPDVGELRQCIEQPAARHGVVFEAGLVDEIIQALRSDSGSIVTGALPLLQYTLDVLWQVEAPSAERTLSRAKYLQIGGVYGALTERAEALYQYQDVPRKKPRTESQQQTMRQVLLRLVDLSGDAASQRAVSKRALRSSFASADEQVLLEQLIDEKLLVSSATPETGSRGAFVEVAHEALMTAWPRLQSWLNEGRASRVLRGQLSADAMHWQTAHLRDPRRASQELWQGSRLDQALALRDGGEFRILFGQLDPEEEAFLLASEEQRIRLQRQEEEQQRWRRRALWVMGAVAAVAIAAALFAVKQRMTADRRLRDAKEAADRMIYAFNDRLAPIAGTMEVQGEILGTATVLLMKLGDSQDPTILQSQAGLHQRRGDLAQQAGDISLAQSEYGQAMELRVQLTKLLSGNPEAMRQLAGAHQRLGEVAEAYADAARADKSYAEATALLRPLAKQSPGDIELQLELAKIEQRRGMIGRRDTSHAEAQAHLDEARRICDAVREKAQSSAKDGGKVAEIYAGLGKAAWEDGARTDAARLQQTALELRKDLVQRYPADGRLKLGLGKSYENAGAVAWIGSDLKLATEQLERARAIFESLASLEAQNKAYRDAVVSTYQTLADLARAQGDLQRSRGFVQKDMELVERVAQTDPSNRIYQLELARAHMRHGDALRRDGTLQSARPDFERALQITRELALQSPESLQIQRALASSYQKLGQLASSEGNQRKAREWAEHALRIHENQHRADPKNPMLRTELANAISRLASEHESEGNSVEARKLKLRALELLEELHRGDPGNRRLRRDLADALRSMASNHKESGELLRAQELGQRALGLYDALFTLEATPELLGELQESYELMAQLAARADKREAADSLLSLAVTRADEQVRRQPDNARYRAHLANAYRTRSDRHRSMARYAQARADLDQAIALRTTLSAAEPNNLSYKSQLASARQSLADVLQREKQLPAAQREREAALVLREAVWRSEPSPSRLRSLNGQLMSMADAATLQGKVVVEEWLGYHKKATDLAAQQLALEPDNQAYRDELIAAFMRKCRTLGWPKNIKEEVLAEACEEAIKLLEKDIKIGTATSWAKFNCSEAFYYLGKYHKNQRKRDLAYSYMLKQRVLLEEVAGFSPIWTRQLPDIYSRIANEETERGFTEKARKIYEEGGVKLESLRAQNPALSTPLQAIATHYVHYANWLHQRRDHTNALKMVDKALATREELLRREPGNLDYRDELASGLKSKSSILHDHGQREAARESCRRAVSLHETIVQIEPGNTNRLPQLASALEDCAELLEESDLRDEVVTLREKAIGVRKRLLEIEPHDSYASYKIAVIFIELSQLSKNHGDLDSAIKERGHAAEYLSQADRESPIPEHYADNKLQNQLEIANILILRRDFGQAASLLNQLQPAATALYQKDPKKARSLLSVYDAQARLATLTGDIARVQQIQQARLRLHEERARAHPEEREFQRALASALEISAARLHSRGRFQAEEPVRKRILAIRERLVAGDAGSKWDRDQYRSALREQANGAASRGDSRETQRLRYEQLSKLEDFEKADSSGVDHQIELSGRQLQLGHAAKFVGDPALARTHYRQGLALVEKVLAINPTLKNAHESLRDVQIALGDLALAEGARGAAVEHWLLAVGDVTRIMQSDPKNAAFKETYIRLALSLSPKLRRGWTSRARELLTQARKLCEELRQAEQKTETWRDLLADLEHEWSLVAEAEEDIPKAEQYARAELALREEIVLAKKATNESHRQDVASAQQQLSDLLLARGDLAQARSLTSQVLALRTELHEREPLNFSRATDLQGAYFRWGNHLRREGDHVGALASYRKGVAVLEGLVNREPEDLKRKAALAEAHASLGKRVFLHRGLAVALTAYAQATALREALTRAEPNAPIYQRELMNHLRSMAETLADAGAFAQARAGYQRAVAVGIKLVQQQKLPSDATRLVSLYVQFSNDAERAKELPLSIQIARKAVDAVPVVPAGKEPEAHHRRFLLSALMRLARSLVANKEFAAARPILDRALALRPPVGSEQQTNEELQADGAQLYLVLGDIERGEEHLLEAKTAYENAARSARRLTEADPYWYRARDLFADSSYRLGQLADLRKQPAEVREAYETPPSLFARSIESAGASPLLKRWLVRTRCDAANEMIKVGAKEAARSQLSLASAELAQLRKAAPGLLNGVLDTLRVNVAFASLSPESGLAEVDAVLGQLDREGRGGDLYDLFELRNRATELRRGKPAPQP